MNQESEHLWKRARSQEESPVMYTMITSVKGEFTGAFIFSTLDKAQLALQDLIVATGGGIQVDIQESIVDAM